jgi:hypothetical protein
MATDHDDLDPLEEDLHAAVARDFRTLVDAAARATDDPDASEGWDVVESAIVALFRHIEHAIVVTGEGPSLEDLTAEPDYTMDAVRRLFEDNCIDCRQERALMAIEYALRQRMRRWKRVQTEIRRFMTVVRMDAEGEKGIPREQALKNIGSSENSIKQYVGWVRALLLSGGLGGPAPQYLKNIGTTSKQGRRQRRR